MLKVMFLCTGNSCRSQMAEGFARELGKGLIDPRSAGLMAAGLNARAVAVMREVGIDISSQRSKEVDPALIVSMDAVITLCENAEATCPATPRGVQRLHWPIRDPVGTIGTDDVVMREFRRARDEIAERVRKFLADLPGSGRW
jgi:arsenate reductase